MSFHVALEDLEEIIIIIIIKKREKGLHASHAKKLNDFYSLMFNVILKKVKQKQQFKTLKNPFHGLLPGKTHSFATFIASKKGKPDF